MNLLIDVSFGEDFVLDPDAVREAAGIDRLGDLRDRHIRELPSVSNLHDPNVKKYIVSTLRDSLRKKERLWLLPMSDSVAAEWEQWLPDGLMTPVGPRQDYLGEEITPMAIAPIKLVGGLADRKCPEDMELLEAALHGMDGLALSEEVYQKVLAVGVHIIERSRLTRTVTNPRFIAYAVVLVYSALRALPVTFVKQFHGSILMLWTIDLVTAIPYTWGVLAMVTASKFRTRIIGMIVTVVTFTAPYIYFGIYGRQYPPKVIAIVAVLILSAFVLEAYKMWGDKRVYWSLTRSRNGDAGC